MALAQRGVGGVKWRWRSGVGGVVGAKGSGDINGVGGAKWRWRKVVLLALVTW